MQEIFQQLGELALGSVPTILFFLFLLIAYAVLVQKPLQKTLAARHARTGGAIEEARNAIAASERKTSEYETRLRHARAEIAEARQRRMKLAADAREKALGEVQARAGAQTAAARASVAQAGAEARAEIESLAAGLAQQIQAAILPSRGEHAGVAQ